MFETSVVHEGAMRSRGRVSLFTISVIAHSAVILGAIGISVANTTFPTVAPDEIMSAPLLLTPVSIPPPLGNPNGGAPPRPAAAPPAPRQPQQQTAPPPETAPDTVPNDVPVLDAPSNGDADQGPAEGLVPGPVGVPWGVDGSPGDPNAPPTPNTAITPEPAERIYTVGEVAAPVLLKRVEPIYPPALVRAKIPGKAIVRCIIDKNGRVRDAEVVFATMPPFGDVTVRALDGWRYKPASLNGNAVDCYLDVVVHFGIK
jgi:TonB family protein